MEVQVAYDGTWRDADPAEVKRRTDAGDPYTIRFKVPKGKVVTIHVSDVLVLMYGGDLGDGDGNHDYGNDDDDDDDDDDDCGDGDDDDDDDDDAFVC